MLPAAAGSSPSMQPLVCWPRAGAFGARGILLPCAQLLWCELYVGKDPFPPKTMYLPPDDDMLTPTGHPPPTPPTQQPTRSTAHTAPSQHCGHTALPPGQKTSPLRRADPTQTFEPHHGLPPCTGRARLDVYIYIYTYIYIYIYIYR